MQGSERHSAMQIESRMDFGPRLIGFEIKWFPPSTYNRDIDEWEDWSWHLKRYVRLYKTIAKVLMDEAEKT